MTVSNGVYETIARIKVKVLKQPVINNTFNAIAIWRNRYGIKLYDSCGYTTPWEGNYRGAPVPAGTYYHLIRLGDNCEPLTGPVTVLR